MDRGAWWVTVHGVTESDTTEATRHGNAARGLGSIPARGTKIPQTMRCSHQKKKKKKDYTPPPLLSQWERVEAKRRGLQGGVQAQTGFGIKSLVEDGGRGDRKR